MVNEKNSIEVTGFIEKKEEKGSAVLKINDIPVAKAFDTMDDQYISLNILVHHSDNKELVRNFKGHAEVYYFEGKQLFFSGTKYVNDFFIDDEDVIETLEEYIDKHVTIHIDIIESTEKIKEKTLPPSYFV
ncbi:MAG: hypothetical protein ACO1OT_06970 [Heyndrickxia sp.]